MKKFNFSTAALLAASMTSSAAFAADQLPLLNEKQMENLVKHSVQYVAMYNVNNKFAMDENSPVTTHGWNNVFRATSLLDHNVKSIARPNNDTLYVTSLIDLRDEPVIMEIPAFDSNYVSLMATGYDHYVNIPLSSLNGDFKEATKVMFYTERTKNMPTELPQGVDQKFEMTGDFVSSVIRVMPHASEPERMDKIIDAMQEVTVSTLFEYNGEQAKTTDIEFPAFSQTDIDTYATNFTDVMQFAVNHTTFDNNSDYDNEALKTFAKIGIRPGQSQPKQAKFAIDSEQLSEKAREHYQAQLAIMGTSDAEILGRIFPVMFQPKGITTAEALQFVSVVGPIGQPIQEASYPPLVTQDGEAFTAQHDYVLRMSKDQLPPVHAFWSVTLYDEENGFFIENEHNKYSVGENAGYELNEQGGVDIYIAAQKPEGVPAANWLPINRGDKRLSSVMRLYNPDLQKLGNWDTPAGQDHERFITT
ncbi:DUF1214 domain-containing protein [Vibrio breoganii]